MPWLDEIADHLDAQPAFDGWGFAIDRVPAAPDRVIALFGTAGQHPETKYPLRHPGLQLRSRGAKDEGAEARAILEIARGFLVAIVDGVFGAFRFVHLIPLGDPAPIGIDDVGRPEFSLNFNVALE